MSEQSDHDKLVKMLIEKEDERKKRIKSNRKFTLGCLGTFFFAFILMIASCMNSCSNTGGIAVEDSEKLSGLTHKEKRNAETAVKTLMTSRMNNLNKVDFKYIKATRHKLEWEFKDTGKEIIQVDGNVRGQDSYGEKVSHIFFVILSYPDGKILQLNVDGELQYDNLEQYINS